MDYTLTITPTDPDQPPAVRNITCGPAEVAQAVHRHARGILGGQVDVHLDTTGLSGDLVQHHALAGAFSLQPAEASLVADLGPLHGWTLADIDRMAASAAVADRTLAMDGFTRYDIAWSAIALAIAEAEQPPAWGALVQAGWQAIYTEVREQRHLYGIPRDDASTGTASARRWSAYWQPIAATPYEERLIEQLAVYQVLDTLPVVYQDAVQALAVHGTLRAAAAALGISEAAMRERMSTAKRRFAARWFAPETAPPTRADRRVAAYGQAPTTHCSAGHEWTPENTRWDRGRGGAGCAKVRRCRACERRRSEERRTRKAQDGVAA